MKISFNWLCEYIDINDYRSQLPELSRLLTAAGLEVEGMNNPAQDWDHVVVGRLLDVGVHPNADKLTLCKVQVAEDEVLQIVCGAKNHKKGDRVAVAKVGAVLKGDFKIKASKIRDVESFGMLCSLSELGLADESEGILILSEDNTIGTPLARISSLSDVIFELNVTPNRADCLSHIGLARELATLLDRPLHLPAPQNPETGKAMEQQIQVQLMDDQACPRYCGRMIRGVKVGPSPDWLKSRLESIGLKSINNVVDVTNFVLFEYGQPLHAFDLRHLSGPQIVIAKAQDGEVFKTLDGSEIKLSHQDLVIRDAEKAVALAGVVGGQNSGVSDQTTDVFLESAFFKSEGVRRTSRSHGIETDSCYRFARGVDPAQTRQAMERAAQLILQVAGGELQLGYVDLYPQPIARNPIIIHVDQVTQRLGFKVIAADFKNWMTRLQCQVSERSGQFEVTPPSYRWDLNIKEDLIEEFARLHGYSALLENLPVLQSEPTRHDPRYVFGRKVAKILTGLGSHQALNYAFIASDDHAEVWGSESTQSWGLNSGAGAVKLLNPLSEDLAVMRESLLPSLLKNLVFNQRHGHLYGRLFELAPVTYRQEKKFNHENRLALVFWGQKDSLWDRPQKNSVVFELKAVVDSLLSALGGKTSRWQQVEQNVPAGFHPGQTASLFYEGKTIGLLGTLHPALKDRYKIREEVAWVELNLDLLGQRQPRSPQFKSIAKFPSMERDIALVGAETIAADTILSEIRRGAGPLLVDLKLFDLYQDEELKKHGRRSVAVRMRFQSEKETLSDEVINSLRDKVVNSVCQKLGLEIR